MVDVVNDAQILRLILHFGPRGGERVHLAGERVDTVGGGGAEVGGLYIIGLEGVGIGSGGRRFFLTGL